MRKLMFPFNRFYTVGHTESYEKYFEEQAQPEKKGRDKDFDPLRQSSTSNYAGGCVFFSIEEAQHYLARRPNVAADFSVYGLDTTRDNIFFHDKSSGYYIIHSCNLYKLNETIVTSTSATVGLLSNFLNTEEYLITRYDWEMKAPQQISVPNEKTQWLHGLGLPVYASLNLRFITRNHVVDAEDKIVLHYSRDDYVIVNELLRSYMKDMNHGRELDML